MKSVNLWIALLLAPVLFSGSSVLGSDIKARMNSSDGSSSFQIMDSNDSEIAAIGSNGDLLLLGSATVNSHMIINGGRTGLGTASPQSTLHQFSPDGSQGSQWIVSTGAIKLFEINGTSVVAGRTLFFPNGTAQATAYLPGGAGVVSLSSVTSVGTITSTSALIAGALLSSDQSLFSHSVRITSLSVTGTITSTSAIRFESGNFSSINSDVITVGSMTSRGTITSTSSLISGALAASSPSDFDDAVYASSLSVVGSITSTDTITAGPASFTSVNTDRIQFASVTFRGTLTSTSSLVAGGIAAWRPSTFSHNVEISSLSAVGTITTTNTITAGDAVFGALATRSIVTAGTLEPIGNLTSTSAAIVGGAESDSPSIFGHQVRISTLEVVGTILSTSPLRGGSGVFDSLTLNGGVTISSVAALHIITSSSALIAGPFRADEPSIFDGRVLISSMSAVGDITSTSPVTGRAAAFRSLDVDGSFRISSVTIRGTLSSTSAWIVPSFTAIRPSTFADTVEIETATVSGSITSTSAVTGRAGVFASLIIRGEVDASSVNAVGTLSSTSPFIAAAFDVARPSTFTHWVNLSTLSVVGTITSTSPITADAATFTSLVLRGAITVASMTAAGTLTSSTSSLTAGSIESDMPSTFLHRVLISSLSVVGTITSTSPIAAASAQLGAVNVSGGLRIASMSAVGTITSTSALIAGGIDVEWASFMNGPVRISSLTTTGDFTSTSALIVGGLDVEWASVLNGAVRISSLTTPGAFTAMNGFVNGRSSMSALYVGDDYANFAVALNGNVGVSTNVAGAKLHVVGPDGGLTHQLLVSTGPNNLLEVTGASTTIDARFFVVNSTASHFENIVQFSTTVYITGPAGSAGNLLIVSTGSLGSSVRNAFMRVSSTGTVSVYGKGAFGTGGADVAEMYESDEKLEAGDLVVAAGRGKIRKSAGSDPGQTILGIVSKEPGIVMGINMDQSVEDMKGWYPVALKGRTPVKVSHENGPIAAGDLLSASSTPGAVSKAVRSMRVVGVALESSGTGGLAGGSVMAFLYQHFWVNPREYELLSMRVRNLETELADAK